LEYKKHLLEEVYTCIKFLKLSYSDVMIMPTYERRFFIVTLQNELIDHEEKSQNTSRVVKTGKNSRKRIFSPK